jgi:hypothetical protein
VLIKMRVLVMDVKIPHQIHPTYAAIRPGRGYSPTTAARAGGTSQKCTIQSRGNVLFMMQTASEQSMTALSKGRVATYKRGSRKISTCQVPYEGQLFNRSKVNGNCECGECCT